MSDNIEWRECVENRRDLMRRIIKLEERVKKIEKVLEDGK